LAIMHAALRWVFSNDPVNYNSFLTAQKSERE
jgi:hypothetical protein